MAKYIIQVRDPDDGEWEDRHQSRSSRAAARRALAITKDVERTYGQRLYIQTRDGRRGRVGDTRVICPDGRILDGLDLYLEADI